MEVSHRFRRKNPPAFDDDNLVSTVGLVPVMTLAKRAGRSALLAEKVYIAEPRRPSPKLGTQIAGMCARADSIDDLDVVHCGGTEDIGSSK